MNDREHVCRHCGEHHEEYDCPRGDIYVPCDQHCKALYNPGDSVEELRKAVEHWREHGNMCGCSHGR
jgi:hypothetical protein